MQDSPVTESDVTDATYHIQTYFQSRNRDTDIEKGHVDPVGGVGSVGKIETVAVMCKTDRCWGPAVRRGSSAAAL